MINILANLLRARRITLANDRNRDLFLPDRTAQMNFLFEAKTDASTSSICHGIGQLLFHSALQSAPTPRLVLVLPGDPNTLTQEVLRRLGTDVLVYCLEEDETTFTNFVDVVH